GHGVLVSAWSTAVCSSDLSPRCGTPCGPARPPAAREGRCRPRSARPARRFASASTLARPFHQQLAVQPHCHPKLTTPNCQSKLTVGNYGGLGCANAGWLAQLPLSASTTADAWQM